MKKKQQKNFKMHDCSLQSDKNQYFVDQTTLLVKITAKSLFSTFISMGWIFPIFQYKLHKLFQFRWIPLVYGNF